MSLDNEYEFLDRLFLRSPFYSVEAYAPGKMKEVLLRADFRNALWLASPDFYRVVEKMRFNWDLLAKNERVSLLKYYNRMSFRATPFGAFSAFSLIPWDGRDQVRLVTGERSVLHLLPSWEWLQARRVQARKEHADYYLMANPTLMPLGERLSFVRSVTGEGGKMQFSLNGIAAEALNLKLVKAAGKKPVLRSKIIQMIVRLTGCSGEEASGYADFLVREQVMLTEFDGCLIEGPPGKFDQQLILFSDTLDLEKETNRFAQDTGAERFAGNRLYSGLERGIQEGGIAPGWQQEILSAISLLRKIVIPYRTPALKDFASAFKARFEDQKIPLLTALDPDTGVGYDSLFGSSEKDGLLKDLSFPAKPKEVRRIDWTAVHLLFFRLWQQTPGRRPFDPLVIQPADTAELETVTTDTQLPPSIAFLFSRSAGKLVLDNNGGASATSLLGRFSAFSTPVWELCREIASAETRANPDVIFAELHQLSDEHTDNINRRRAVYDHIIHINTFAKDTGQTVIPLRDLVLSVQDGNILLESVSTGKRVVPRLPTAYNFHHNQLAIFRFLGDLQYQGIRANLTFDLEKLFPGLDFYPRVEFGKTVISLAKWRLSGQEVRSLTGDQISISALHLLRQQRGIPAQITMGISDRQLAFDLASDEQSVFFLECLKGLNTVVLRECLEPDRSVTSGKQILAGQFIAVLTKRLPVYRAMLPEITERPDRVQRSFLPGSEWIYLKLYGTEETADPLLVSLIAPFIAVHQTKIKQWFFIRYHDPEPHIRLRILTGPSHYGTLIKTFRRELSKNVAATGLRDLRQDTYRRELERYDAGIMELVEACFCKGSLLAVQKIGSEPAAFRLVYQMAEIFITGTAALAAFLNDRKAVFINEFGREKDFRLSLDRKYRTLSKKLIIELEQERSAALPQYELEFKGSVAAIAEKTRSWPADKRLRLLADLIHMQVNRLFSHQQRRHEALIFFCLSRYSASLLARKKS